ncbi:MAG: transcription elongation factor GreB [Xanthomonadales bacterium]|nr:transcription elongation factor GreB [Xanthomonadales bacterium]
MGRWRPPPEKSSPYITAEGALAMKTQLAELWSLRRNDVVPALSAAAAEGDRSENAEYIYRKKQLGEIDRNIRYITKRLEVMKVVDQAPSNRNKIYFGARIELLNEQGTQHSYRIVGPDETDAAKGYISMDSPMAKALLGRQPGDVVRVQLPQGRVELEVMGVSYSVTPA